MTHVWISGASPSPCCSSAPGPVTNPSSDIVMSAITIGIAASSGQFGAQVRSEAQRERGERKCWRRHRGAREHCAAGDEEIGDIVDATVAVDDTSGRILM